MCVVDVAEYSDEYGGGVGGVEREVAFVVVMVVMILVVLGSQEEVRCCTCRWLW